MQNYLFEIKLFLHLTLCIAESAKAVPNTDCFSAVGEDECPGYHTKQSDGEIPVMLELGRMGSTSSLPSLLDPLWPGVVAPDRFLSMGQIELNYVFMLN